MWLQLPGSLTSSIAATVMPRNTSSETSRPLPLGPAGGDVTVLLQSVELAREIVPDHLDPQQSQGVETGRLRPSCRAAGHLEDRVEAIAHDLSGFRVAPAPRVRELPVPGPDAQRKRERPHPNSGNGRVDRDQTPGDLFLDRGIGQGGKVGVPKRVGAQLEALLVQEAKLGEPPGGLLAVG